MGVERIDSLDFTVWKGRQQRNVGFGMPFLAAGWAGIS